MFSIFKKNNDYKPISEFPASWSILEAKNEGLIVRVNAGYKKAIGHPDYPIKMGIALPISSKHDEAVANLKYQIEDTLEKLFHENNGALVAVVTGMKDPKFIEFLSYAKDGLDFASIHKTLKSKFPNEDVQMYAKGDPEWNAYKSFLK